MKWLLCLLILLIAPLAALDQARIDDNLRAIHALVEDGYTSAAIHECDLLIEDGFIDGLERIHYLATHSELVGPMKYLEDMCLIKEICQGDLAGIEIFEQYR